MFLSPHTYSLTKVTKGAISDKCFLVLIEKKKEFLQNLQVRQKWVAPSLDIQVNDVVLVKDDERPRNQCQLAEVIEVFPGSNNHVRKVKVAMSAQLSNSGKCDGPLTVFERPVNKLVLLVENLEPKILHKGPSSDGQN